jgi:hypothetical protein
MMGLTPHETDLARDHGRRAAYIQGLRALADILENHPEVPLPYHGDGTAITISAFLSAADPRAELAAAARAFPCAWRKKVRGDDQYGNYFDLRGELAGLRLCLTAYRDAVCERVITGTEDREVEEVVTPAVTRTVTKPVEIVQWVCHPVLAPAARDNGAEDRAA